MFPGKLSAQSLVKLDELSKSSTNMKVFLVVSTNSDNEFLCIFVSAKSTPLGISTYSVGVISHRSLDRRDAHGGHIHIPGVNGVAFGHVNQQALVIGASLNNFHLRELDSLLISRRGRHTRNHHQLHQLLAFPG